MKELEGAIKKAAREDWRGPAEKALQELLSELVNRKCELKAIELIGAVRAIAEAITASRALLPNDD